MELRGLGWCKILDYQLTTNNYRVNPPDPCSSVAPKARIPLVNKWCKLEVCSLNSELQAFLVRFLTLRGNPLNFSLPVIKREKS